MNGAGGAGAVETDPSGLIMLIVHQVEAVKVFFGVGGWGRAAAARLRQQREQVWREAAELSCEERLADS